MLKMLGFLRLQSTYTKEYAQVHDATRQGRHSRVRTRRNERDNIRVSGAAISPYTPLNDKVKLTYKP